MHRRQFIQQIYVHTEHTANQASAGRPAAVLKRGYKHELMSGHMQCQNCTTALTREHYCLLVDEMCRVKDNDRPC